MPNWGRVDSEVVKRMSLMKVLVKVYGISSKNRNRCVIDILMRIDHPLWHPRPHLAKELDATTAVDESRIGITHPIFLVDHGKAMIAYSIYFHRNGQL